MCYVFADEYDKLYQIEVAGVWIAVRPTENSSTLLYKNGDISVVVSCS